MGGRVGDKTYTNTKNGKLPWNKNRVLVFIKLRHYEIIRELSHKVNYGEPVRSTTSTKTVRHIPPTFNYAALCM